MITASIYGRLGRDPKLGQTKTGKAMCNARVAVDAGKEPGEETVWITVMAFGHLAEFLQRHSQGDMLAATGNLTKSRYTGRDGQERESWSLIADSIHSSRTVRYGQRNGTGKGGTRDAGRTGGDMPYDDPLTL